MEVRYNTLLIPITVPMNKNGLVAAEPVHQKVSNNIGQSTNERLTQEFKFKFNYGTCLLQSWQGFKSDIKTHWIANSGTINYCWAQFSVSPFSLSALSLSPRLSQSLSSMAFKT